MLGNRNSQDNDFDDCEVEEIEIYMVFEYLDHDLAGIMSNPEIKLQVRIYSNFNTNFRYLFRKNT